VPQQTVTRKLAELPSSFPGKERAKLSEYVLPWLDLLAWTQREVGEGVGLAQPNVRQRIIRFCKTGESAKSYNAEADDPDDEKSGPDPYQMVRAGLNAEGSGRRRRDGLHRRKPASVAILQNGRICKIATSRSRGPGGWLSVRHIHRDRRT